MYKQDLASSSLSKRLSPQLQQVLDERIRVPLAKIAEFCDRWKIVEFSLFGSVLRDDFRCDSDIDVMVQFHREAHPTFYTLEQMEAELKTIFNRDIDVITRYGIETSRNYLRRQEILSSAQVIYATGYSI
ncbi:MAG: nucleotidyltransferase [Okeania sp. SIO2D1]|nr:nucleotidyltransferase [Okeania sp. SIO2D1]